MPKKEIIHAIYEPDAGTVAIRTACGRLTSAHKEGKGGLTFVDVQELPDRVNCSGCLNVTRAHKTPGAWAQSGYHYDAAF